MHEQTPHNGKRPPGADQIPDVLIAGLDSHSIGLTARNYRLIDFLSLTKPEITFLVSISALAGFVLGSPAGIDGWTLFWAMVGIPLVSAGGAALNHFEEREPDGIMRRTAARPLPAGRILPDHARAFGYILIGAGLAVLCPLTNPLTGVLAAITVIVYIYVYTPLKRITPFNTIVGTIPGALPALGGWTAATGHIGTGGLAIFAILLFWQMPHFMSLAWMYRKDYERAGFKMWTITDENGTLTVVLTVGFTALTVLASLVPFFIGVSGLVYLLGSLALGGWFAWFVAKFTITRSVLHAREVLKGSIWYIPALLLLIMADRFLS